VSARSPDVKIVASSYVPSSVFAVYAAADERKSIIMQSAVLQSHRATQRRHPRKGVSGGCVAVSSAAVASKLTARVQRVQLYTERLVVIKANDVASFSASDAAYESVEFASQSDQVKCQELEKVRWQKRRCIRTKWTGMRFWTICPAV